MTMRQRAGLTLIIISLTAKENIGEFSKVAAMIGFIIGVAMFIWPTEKEAKQ